MLDAQTFPILNRWPAEHPDRIQLFSFPTPNGVKVSIALEEMGLPYEAHKVTLADADVKSPEFLSLNPNNKIPAIIDPNGPDGPLGLFESGAILLYLADKSGKFGGDTATDRWRVTQWLMFQMGGLGPMLGQVGFFWKFAGSEWEDKRPQQRYINEAKRLLSVLEGELSGRDWIAGDYSIADMAIAPWLRALDFYGAKDAVEWDDRPALNAYLARFLDRPAVQVGLVTPPRD
ncbi:glutathione S-transferase family protein [Pseudaestuariivita atlantica]|uniref:Glutathione S-transferase n=1 Tax=Pseudaestuariivita atlantica TaxID=1317121 RepID=A0A0L1JSB7_9RHOB|nr:glutathione S-transferase N-terminal domain-containing protein [Pseudaestuariivita atlantica]KNG94293.1 glutathione S-transferase [Pseudaestuariivita atlantica]